MASIEGTTLGPVEPTGEDVVLLTADDVLLSGRWTSAEPGRWLGETAGGMSGAVTGPSRASVVLVHGFTGRKDEPAVLDLAKRLHEAGYSVLTYDARGHGASGGESGVGSLEHLDVAAAVEVAASHRLPVVAVGISMGAVATVRFLAESKVGAPGLSTAAANPVAGAVLVSGPARWRMRPHPVGVVTALLTRTPPGRFTARRWLGVRVARAWRTGETPEAMVRRVRVPLAVLHGTGDRLLASSHANRLHGSAGGPVRLEVVEGMGHGPRGAAEPVVSAVGWVLDAAAPEWSRSLSGPPGATRKPPGPVSATI